MKWSVWLLALGLVFGASSAHADYAVTVGDVIEITAVGTPEVVGRSMVDVDGFINLPAAGPIRAVGLDLNELRRRVNERLSKTSFHRRLPNGAEQIVVVAPGSVGVSIAEYAPVYVDGDVQRPGAVGFRPGLTVRKAVALAGGLSRLADLTPNVVIGYAGLKSEYDRLLFELVAEEAKLRRFSAELEGKQELPSTKLPGRFPVPNAVRGSVEASEMRQLRERVSQAERERDILNGAKRRTESQLKFISEAEENDKRGLEISQAEVDRFLKLSARGLTNSAAIVEARRNLLLQQQRQLDTLAQRIIVENQRDETSLRLEQVEAARQIGIVQQKNEAEIRVATIMKRLASIRDTLKELGGVSLGSAVGAGNVKKIITIVRRADGSNRYIEGKEEMQVLPGDVITVDVDEGGSALKF